MKRIVFSSLIGLLFCISLYADNDSLFLYRYMNMLHFYKDSLEHSVQTEVDARYYRLFAPPTFYHSPIKGFLCIGGNSKKMTPQKRLLTRP